MYSSGVLLGDQSERGWGLSYAREFDMTNDSKLFPPRPKWEEKQYRPDEYGHWLKGKWHASEDFGVEAGLITQPAHLRAASVIKRQGILLSRDGSQAIRIEDIEDMAVPLYEGRMIGQCDFSQKGWVSGKGRTAVWREIPWADKQIEPQYLMAISTLFAQRLEKHLRSVAETGGEHAVICERQRLNDPASFMQWWRAFGPKTCFMDVSSATNARAMISAAVPDFPSGNKTPVLWGKNSGELAIALNSLGYDYALRQRLGGMTLNYFIVEETPLPLLEANRDLFLELSRRLDFTAPVFASSWHDATNREASWQCHWALTEHERLRLRCVADAVVALAFGLSVEDMRWIAHDTDHPAAQLRDLDSMPSLNPKGFWRVDKEKDPELRHTVLAQVAYADLCAQGLDAFLAGPDGDGWQLPETLCLADYGLGHDDRAKEPQPVASRLGPRFLDWQLAKDPAQSWAECEAHAAQLEALWHHARHLATPTTAISSSDSPLPTLMAAEAPASYHTKRPSGTNQLSLDL